MNIPEKEQKFVIETYNTIAKKWDKTRYRIWPVVEEYLRSLKSNSKVLEVGCGNGKNMILENVDLDFWGNDASKGQIEIAKSKGIPESRLEIMDICDLKYDFEFDHLICIAVFHHLSTDERRNNAFNEMLKVLKQNGTMLISLWSFEPTDAIGRRKFENQDEMVPFKVPVKDHEKKYTVHKRYYHLYKETEFDKFIEPYIMSGKIKLIKKSIEKNNYFYEIEKL